MNALVRQQDFGRHWGYCYAATTKVGFFVDARKTKRPLYIILCDYTNNLLFSEDVE